MPLALTSTSLSPQEQAAFESSKAQLKLRVPAAVSLPDDTLWRFLVARKYNAEHAAKLLSDDMRWRQEHQIDGILQEYFPPQLRKQYQCGYHGRDPQGNPVFLDLVGRCTPSELFGKNDLEVLLRWHVAIMETGRQTYNRLTGGKCEGIIVVMDLNGLGMKHVDKQAVRFVRAVAALDQLHYPEHLRKCFVINAGKMFHLAYKMIEKFIDPRTREKLVVLGKDYAPTIQQHIHPSQLPTFLGGTCSQCPGGCLSNIVYGARDPTNAKPLVRGRVPLAIVPDLTAAEETEAAKIAADVT